MLTADEDAVICDLAETYGIFNMESLPVQLVATLCVGLRGDSRIKLKMTGQDMGLTDLLLSVIADYVALNVWAKTKDGQHGRNRPKPLREVMFAKKNKEIESFDTSAEFERARQRILEEVAHG